MSEASSQDSSFKDLALPPTLLGVLDELGYETPTPIQRQAIPALLRGKDVLGHAPTGTGKTAAFALPLLSRIDTEGDPEPGFPQVLALTPTRELAIQVAEAFQRYASAMPGFRVLPIYGGQQYGGQLRQLKRGVQVVVGTPGRVMDHIRKGTLKLGRLQALVLDEADEMLRMGFLEEVEWILEQTPAERQTALFSATMPKQVERIARQYLNDPAKVAIKAKTATAETIRQRYWQVSGVHKLDALTRILETERFDAILLFVRTKLATTELASKLSARGFAAAAMNGDMAQDQRERTVDQLKQGRLNVLVATDVAARGLDVERISHVINYDVPYDTEAYIHRIGRTGRAGRQGEAILFIAPRERRLLSAIERATRQKIERMQLPSTEAVNDHRISNFKQQISDTLANGDLEFMRELMQTYVTENELEAVDVAAALGQLLVGEQGLLVKEGAVSARPQEDRAGPAVDRKPRARARPADREEPEEGMERFRLEVGRDHGVKPGNIVGAIANEAGIEGEYIGRIVLEADHSTVDLPVGMPKEVFHSLKRVQVCGRQLQISRYAASGGEKQEMVSRQMHAARKDTAQHVDSETRAEGPPLGGERPVRRPTRRPAGQGSPERRTSSRSASADRSPKRDGSSSRRGKAPNAKGSQLKSSRKRKSNAASSAQRGKS